jgi:hypothetical protein
MPARNCSTSNGALLQSMPIAHVAGLLGGETTAVGHGAMVAVRCARGIGTLPQNCRATNRSAYGLR